VPLTAAKAVSDRAKILDEGVRHLRELVVTNTLNVNNLIRNIGKSAEASGQTITNVRILEERTNNINKIVDKIVNVALQTNMLAVNGSIEAARAGEFGRGFSVVAGDIRTLANDSSENAERIKEMVRTMQSQITLVANDLETASKIATEEMEGAKESTNNLAFIETEMADVASGIQSITDGINQTLVAVEQGGRAVAEIANAAHEASKVVEEASKAAEQSSRGMELIAEAVEEIAGQADELQNMGG